MKLNSKINLYAKYLLLVWLVMGGVSSLKATHIVGGDLTYTCLGNELYELTLTVRRDCELGAADAQFDNPASIGIFDTQGNILFDVGIAGQLLIPFVEDDTLDTQFMSDCGFIGEQVCVHEAVYKKRVKLPSRVGGYVLAYQRCCRNESLNNINAPLETGSTYFVEISTEALSVCNSSPVFNEWGDLYICANEILDFSHAAIDPDGDSLVYKLCTPYTGASFDQPQPQPPTGPTYNTVSFLPPYSVTDMMGGDPLVIDSASGQFYAVPNLVGQYLIGVCVEEYRDGVLLSTIRRDFEYNVRVCSQGTTASFDVDDFDCGDTQLSFTNTSLSADSYNWNFDFPSSDPAFMSTDENPSFEFPGPGTYTVLLEAVRAQDGCTDTHTEEIVISDASVNADFTAMFVQCDNDTYSLTLMDATTLSSGTLTTWDWLVTQGANTTMASGPEVVLILNSGDPVVVNLTAGISDGCVATDTETISLSAIPDFNVSVELMDCDGLNNTYSLSLDDMGFLPGSVVNWDLNVDGVAISLTGNPVMITSESDKLSGEVSLTVNSECQLAQSLDIDLKDAAGVPKPEISFNVTDCNSSNEWELELTASLPSGSAFVIEAANWTVTNGSSTQNAIGNPVVLNVDPTLTSSVEVEVKLEGFNCFVNTKLDIEDMNPFDILLPEDVSVCKGDSLMINIPDVDGLSILWDAHPFLTNPLNSLNQLFVVPVNQMIGTETLSYTLTDINGCSMSFDFDMNVEEHVVLSSIYTRLDCDTFEACFENTSSVITDVVWTFATDNGTVLGTSNEPNPCFVFPGVGSYHVTLSGTSQFCSGIPYINCVNFSDPTVMIDNYQETLTVCDGDMISLSANASIDNDSISWCDVTGTDEITIGQGPTLSITPYDGQIIVAKVSQFDDCSRYSDSTLVMLNTVDLGDFDALEVCRNDEFVLNSFSGSTLDFNWQANPFLVAGLNTPSPSISITSNIAAGPYQLDFTVSDGSCSKDTFFVMNVRQTPDFSFDYVLQDCENYRVCFTATNATGESLLWDFGDTTSTTDQSTDNAPCYDYGVADNYTVTLSLASGFCMDATVMEEIVVANPTVTIDGLDAVDNFFYCDQSDITLTASSSTTGTYTWYDESGAQVGIGPSIVVPAVDGEAYSVILESANACQSDAAVATLVDGTLVVDVSQQPVTLCPGDEINANISTTQTVDFEWLPHPFLISGLDTNMPLIQIPANQAADTYILQFVAVNHYGCEDTFDFQVNVIDMPDLTFTYTIEDCENLIVCFTPSSITNQSLMWDFGDPTVTTDQSDEDTPCYQYSNQGMYTVTLSLQGGACMGASMTQEIEVANPNVSILDVDADGNLIFCSNDDISLSANGSISGNLTWFDASGTQVGTGMSLTVPAEDSAQYIVVLEDANGCSSDSSEVTLIDGILDLDIFQPLTLCRGDQSFANVISDQIVTYQWMSHPFLTSGLDTNMPTLEIPSDQPTGVYNLQFEAVNQFDCLDTFDFQIEVIENSPLEIAYEVTDCENYTVCFSNSNPMSGILIWNFGDLTTMDDISPLDEPCYTYPGPGTYEVTLSTVTGTCAGAPDTLQITLYDSIGIEILNLQDTVLVCSSDSISVSAEVDDPIATIQWCDQNGMVLANGNDVLISPYDGLILIAKAIDPNGCATASEPVVFEVGDLELDFDSPMDVCEGDTIILDVQPQDGITFLWDDHPVIISGNDTGNPTVFVDPSNIDTLIHLNFTATNLTGCVVDTFFTLNIVDNAIMSFDYAVTDCENYTVCFENTSGFMDIFWDFGDLTTEMDTSSLQNPCYTYPGPGSYIVMLSAGDLMGACNAVPFTDTITLFETPIIDLGVNVMDQEVCLGDTITLSATSNSMPITWCLLDTAVMVLGTGPSIDVVVDEDLQIIAKVSDPNGCAASSDTIDLTVYQFDLTLGDLPVICDGLETTASIINNDTTDVFTYLWTPDDCIVSGGDTQNPVVFGSTSKLLQVLVTDTLSTCATTIDVPLSVTDLSIDITDDVTIIAGEEVVIEVFGTAVGDSILWSNGSNEVQQTLMPEVTTVFSVIVIDEFGCSQALSVTVTVLEPRCDDESVFLPTGFSPNLDGENDVLFVRSLFIEEMELTIYNRWGEEIFRSDDIRDGWDGTYKGKPLAPDTYAYCLRSTCINGEENVRTGNVSLIR